MTQNSGSPAIGTVASNLPSCYLDASWQKSAMQVALECAQTCAGRGEVPVGAALYWDGELLAKASNAREELNDPLAHAEVLVIQSASRKLGKWRLDRALLVVTLEPCPMCMGAVLQARIPLLVYGADDAKAGAAGTLLDLSNDPRLNHSVKVVRGVCREESAKLLGDFFAGLRRGGQD